MDVDHDSPIGLSRGTEMLILGKGCGLERVQVAVNDFYKATDDYMQRLGFIPASDGFHPWGTRSSSIFLRGLASLELMGVHERKKVDRDYLGVLERREGPYAIAFEVSNIDRTANLLRSRDFIMSGIDVGTVQYEGVETAPPELWRGLSVWGLPYSGLIGFLQYNKTARNQLIRKYPHLERRRYMNHPNTAKALRAVWLSVQSLSESVSSFERMGFQRGAFVALSPLGARGCEIEAGGCSILLVEPVDQRSIARRFLEKYGQNFMGVSIEVGDLESARDFIEIRGDFRLQPYSGAYGQSMLIPSELAHGLWIELFQQE
jgi:hypothetical protein